jgi:hypothetical protein
MRDLGVEVMLLTKVRFQVTCFHHTCFCLAVGQVGFLSLIFHLILSSSCLNDQPRPKAGLWCARCGRTVAAWCALGRSQEDKIAA